MEKTILSISGMHCASCAANIEHTLRKEAGIKSANVNLAVEKLYLEYDSAAIGLEKIKNLVVKLGYQIREAGGTAEEMSRGEHDHHGKIRELKKTVYYRFDFRPTDYLYGHGGINRLAHADDFGKIRYAVAVYFINGRYHSYLQHLDRRF